MGCRYFFYMLTYIFKKQIVMCKQILGTQKWALESVWLRSLKLLCSPCVRGPSVDEICRSLCRFSMLESCVGWAASVTYMHISKEIGPPPQFSKMEEMQWWSYFLGEGLWAHPIRLIFFTVNIDAKYSSPGGKSIRKGSDPAVVVHTLAGLLCL